MCIIYKRYKMINNVIVHVELQKIKAAEKNNQKIFF